MTLPATITTERLTLRPFEMRDLDGYVGYYTSPDRSAGVGGPKPKYVVTERFLAMAGQWALRGYGRYAVADQDGGPAFGHVGIMHIEEEAEPEITWTLWDEAQTGKGYATEAAKPALDAWLATHDHVIAHIEQDNIASQRVAERLGMEHDPSLPAPAWTDNGLTYIARAAA
ncbi:MAG: GNAT family N-acetyltransferase [Pseudomonadota bacterium]